MCSHQPGLVMQFFVAAACALLGTGCYANHGGAPTPDASHAARDAAPATYPDGALVPDTYGWLFDEHDGGTLPQQDAGVRPLPDSGPLDDLAGEVWDGYLEAFTFPSGSDHVHIVFDSWSGTGPRTGIMVLGDPTMAPPPATDPNVGYRPQGQRCGAGVLEGYPYRFTNGATSATRVQLGVDVSQPWVPWCELQYPVANPPGGTAFTCVPGTMGRGLNTDCAYLDPYTMAWIAVDCARVDDCSEGTSICTCTATGCTLDPSRCGSPIVVDFHVTGTDGVGSVDGHMSYLTRS